MAAFPDLKSYSSAWPVTDIIMMRLKYTSSQARHREIEMATGKGRHMCSSVHLYVVLLIPTANDIFDRSKSNSLMSYVLRWSELYNPCQLPTFLLPQQTSVECLQLPVRSSSLEWSCATNQLTKSFIHSMDYMARQVERRL